MSAETLINTQQSTLLTLDSLRQLINDPREIQNPSVRTHKTL